MRDNLCTLLDKSIVWYSMVHIKLVWCIRFGPGHGLTGLSCLKEVTVGEPLPTCGPPSLRSIIIINLETCKGYPPYPPPSGPTTKAPPPPPPLKLSGHRKFF